jgi:hypothetical protein
MNWLALLNLIIPAATNLVVLIKNESGTTTAILSSTATATADEIAQMQAFLVAHQAQMQMPGTTTTTVSMTK